MEQQVMRGKSQGIRYWIGTLINFMVAVAVFLFFLSAYTVHQLKNVSSTDDILVKQVKPTIDYYDWNVNQPPIFNVQYIQNDQTCGSGWVDFQSIYEWPGNYQGCEVTTVVDQIPNIKYHKGVCESDSTDQILINKHEAVDLAIWKKGKLCVKYNEEAAETNITKTEDQTCQSGWYSCDSCTCINCDDDSKCTRTTDAEYNCPVTDFSIKQEGFNFIAPLKADNTNIITDSEGYTWVAAKGYKSPGKTPYLISFKVEMLGDTCKNPNFHPLKFNEEDGFGQLLVNLGTGCGLFDTDSNYTRKVDAQKQWNFYELDNEQVMGERLSMIGYKEYVENGFQSEAYLLGQYQIQRKCTFECLDFRYSKKFTDIYQNFMVIQSQVKTLAYVTVFLCLFVMYALCRYFVNRKTIQQGSFVCLYAICLASAFIMTVLLIRINMAIVQDFDPHRKSYLQIYFDNCIIDEGWNSVLVYFLGLFSVGTLHTVLKCLLLVFLVLFISGSVLLCYCLQQIAKVKREVYWSQDWSQQQQFSENEMIQ